MTVFIFITAVVAVMEMSYMIITVVCYCPEIVNLAASTYDISLTTVGGTVCDFCLWQILGMLLTSYTLGSIVM